MLYYAVVFLVIALVAAALGFGGIAGASAGIAQILFFLFLLFFAVSFYGINLFTAFCFNSLYFWRIRFIENSKATRTTKRRMPSPWK